MTDRELERQLRSWYRTRVDAREAAPAALRASVASIPGSQPTSVPIFDARHHLALLAAAGLLGLLVVGALVLGSGRVRLTSVLPSPTPQSSSLPSPALSTEPSGRFLAIYQRGPTSGEVFTFDPVSGVRTSIATLPFSDHIGDFPPGFGEFVQWSTARDLITIVNKDRLLGAAQVRLSDGTVTKLRYPTEAGGMHPVSPDGTRIADAFLLNTAGSSGYAYSVVVGGLSVPLPAGLEVTGVTWSPDGRSILVNTCPSCNNVDRGPGPASDSAYYIAPLDGRPVRRLTAATTGRISAGRWSPDGSAIAFSDECATACGGIQIVNVADGRIVQLTTAPGDTEPVWSRDGRRIAFVRAFGAGRGIWVMDADGGNLTELTTAAVDYSERAPLWSPDGTSIVFTEGVSSSTNLGDLWIVPSEGGKAELLFKDAIADW